MTPELFLLNCRNIKQDNILLFDMDGSLLDTNLANNEAYRYALWKVTGKSDYWQLADVRRITRNTIAELPEITSQMLEDIVQCKKYAFRYKLDYTYPFITHDILRRHSLNLNCYIISTADKERVQQLTQHYQLDRFVKGYIFADINNKYQDIALKLNTAPSKIILFEDDSDAITNAIVNGIKEEQIISIHPDSLKKHAILHNDFLKQDVIAYYSLDYLRYGHPDNPNFINILKNQFNECPSDYLDTALNILKKYLKRDIRSIFEMMGKNELTIVAIPRSKAECEYAPTQQYFRRGVQEAVVELRKEDGLNLIDGSHFISRHTNTKTTHLSKNDNVENDGEMPYVSITKDTCTISEQVEGKDILLIDDIYTLDVNIDEDAIQALYDIGAKSVRFYSVCKTFKIRKRKA